MYEKNSGASFARVRGHFERAKGEGAGKVTDGWRIRSELRLYSEERRKAVGTDEKGRKRTKKTNETTSPVTGG